MIYIEMPRLKYWEHKEKNYSKFVNKHFFINKISKIKNILQFHL